LFLGEYTIGGQRYQVLAHEKVLSRSSDPKFGATLGEIDIRDAHEAIVYQKTFPFDVQDGHFSRVLAASATAFNGAGGAALAIRYLEEPAAPAGAESWQVFAPVNGKLQLFGTPLPPGGNTNLAVGGVLTGVMVGDGVNVMPLASKAEALEFRAWAGNFFVYVPVRIDWDQGQWGEGEDCYALENGTLRKTGCNMRTSAVPRPSQGEGGAISFYEGPVEDPYHSSPVQVESGTPVEVVEARAVVNWKHSNSRVYCQFDEMWLHVRIHGNLGWVHGQDAFDVLGLPATPPPE